MNCLVIDDEPLARELLASYISQTPGLVLVGVAEGAIKALEILRQKKVDVIFLDVQMPNITGIQFLKMIEKQYAVILTTAYAEYALDGFELNVTDYLLKPISFERYYRAVSKLQKVSPAEITDTTEETKLLFVKTDSKLVRINQADILFAEGLRDYIAIQTKTDRLITYYSLRDLEAELPGDKFMRIHKSFLIALDKIDSIERSRVFIGKYILPVGATYRNTFFEHIDPRQKL
ncbi:MAG: LytR/AlgR family response regulator transcription factor [Bacteroidia bacterium]